MNLTEILLSIVIVILLHKLLLLIILGPIVLFYYCIKYYAIRFIYRLKGLPPPNVVH